MGAHVRRAQRNRSGRHSGVTKRPVAGTVLVPAHDQRVARRRGRLRDEGRGVLRVELVPCFVQGAGGAHFCIEVPLGVALAREAEDDREPEVAGADLGSIRAIFVRVPLFGVAT